MSDRAAALARRVSDRPLFLAHALAIYARAEALNDEDLAKRLGCEPAQLAAIRLCRRPRPTADVFQRDVDRIADAFQINGGVVADAVRLADAVQALKQVDAGSGSLMAARDRPADHPYDAGEGEGEDEP